MKKIFSILAIAVAVLSLSSCYRDDDEVFPEKAAVRANGSASEIAEILKSSPNGWSMKYYTGEEYTGSGMYLLVRFTDDYAFIASDRVASDSIDHCTWAVRKDMGSVLSFDTYAPLLHSLSAPSSSKVDGDEADYEFIVMSASKDSVCVKGKKWGNRMTLVRMDENVEWKDFIDKRQFVRDNIASNYFTPDSTAIEINVKKNRMFIDGDALGVAFVYEPDGLNLQESVKIDGKKVSFIAFDTTELTLSTGQEAWIPQLPSLSSLFLNNVWYMTDEMSSNFKLYMSQGVKGSKSIGESVEFFAFAPDDPGYIAFVFQSGENLCYFWFLVDVISDDEVELTMYSYDDNGMKYAQSYGYNYVYSILWSKFKITADNPANPTKLTLTHAEGNKAGEWCTFSLEEFDYPFGE